MTARESEDAGRAATDTRVAIARAATAPRAPGRRFGPGEPSSMPLKRLWVVSALAALAASGFAMSWIAGRLDASPSRAPEALAAGVSLRERGPANPRRMAADLGITPGAA